MKIEALTNGKLGDFLDYCRRHRFEHDESFLNEEQLESFNPDENNPTYLLLDHNGELIGVVSLLIQPYLTDLKRGRFRIIHSTSTELEAYRLMLEAIKPHINELDHIYLFIPEAKVEVSAILEELKFHVYKYTWVLVRDNIEVPAAQFPEGFNVKTLVFDRDEEAWCKVRNAAFATLKGSETPATPEMVKELGQHDDYVDGGMLILWKGDEPVGVIRVCKEIEDDKEYSFIGPLAILPEYQGMGLGRQLLRAGLSFGRSANLPYSMLCVNAENSKAAELYYKENYTKQVVMICYKLQIK